MGKTAKTDHPVHELIAGRWSPYTFSDKPVTNETLDAVLEAARWAPSCFNEQPWSFIVARKSDPGEFERMLGCLVEGNRVWALNAPVLMLSVAKLAFERNGKPNRHAFHDVGQAAANLTFQAGALGLAVHQMGGFDLDKARQTYGIPQGHEPVAAIAIGYPGEPGDLAEDLRARELAPRSRKPVAEFAFRESWGSGI